MNKKLERMLKEYPQMVLERNTLQHQMAHFKGVTAEEVIESMYTPHNDGERVETSTLSDKTAQIAMTYQERMERINREWFEYIEKRFMILDEDVRFFESALASLPDPYAPIMQDMLLHQMTWDSLEVKYNVCRMTLTRYRKKALADLSFLFDRHEQDMAAYLLS